MTQVQLAWFWHPWESLDRSNLPGQEKPLVLRITMLPILRNWWLREPAIVSAGYGRLARADCSLSMISYMGFASHGLRFHGHGVDLITHKWLVFNVRFPSFLHAA
jgi:hypothetical protein